MMSFFSRYRFEIGGALFCLMCGMLSGYGMKAADPSWYQGLVKPSFNPPSWVFGPAWTTLYILMGIVLGKLWKNLPHTKAAVGLFMLQFAFNLAWTSLFFSLNRIDLALYDLLLLWASLFFFMISVRKEKTLILLMMPYVLWTTFALVLNARLFFLNPV